MAGVLRWRAEDQATEIAGPASRDPPSGNRRGVQLCCRRPVFAKGYARQAQRRKEGRKGKGQVVGAA